MPQRKRPNLRKLLFVLPNLFTVSSIFCGFYAIVVLSTGEVTGQDLYKAALLVFFATFFDAFDGRVARMTRTQTEFGKELDSLADVISFGVAPGLLVYQWGLVNLGVVGLVLAFLFPVCGALRLARFMVIASRGGEEASKFFTGLPIPLAAGTLVSVVIAHHKSGHEAVHAGWVGLLVLVLSLLMVSNVRYRSFKDVRISPASVAVFALLLGGGIAISIGVRASVALVVCFLTYICMGLLEETVLQLRRLRGLAATPAGSSGPMEKAGEMAEEQTDVGEAEEEAQWR